MDAHERYNLVCSIIEKLFSAERRRLQKFIDDLLKENQETTGQKTDAFRYNGQLYVPSGSAQGLKSSTTLDIKLWPKMDMYLKDTETIKNDAQEIRQILFKLLFNAETDQQIRDALPDCIIDTAEGFSSIPRMDNPEHIIMNDNRAIRQYRKVLPKIEFYATARLIY